MPYLKPHKARPMLCLWIDIAECVYVSVLRDRLNIWADHFLIPFHSKWCVWVAFCLWGFWKGENSDYLWYFTEFITGVLTPLWYSWMSVSFLFHINTSLQQRRTFVQNGQQWLLRVCVQKRKQLTQSNKSVGNRNRIQIKRRYPIGKKCEIRRRGHQLWLQIRAM